MKIKIDSSKLISIGVGIVGIAGVLLGGLNEKNQKESLKKEILKELSNQTKES